MKVQSSNGILRFQNIPRGMMKLTDDELQRLIHLGVFTKARISYDKLVGDIKNSVPSGLASEHTGKIYLKVARELAKRLADRGLANDEVIEYEKLSPIEQSAIRMIRNDSNRDTVHLKGDYVVSSFLEIENIKRNYTDPPLKRLQLTDKQLNRIFQLKRENIAVREISRQLGLNRGTVYKILKKDYINEHDIERIKAAEKLSLN